MHYLISYVWERRGIDITSNELWSGTVGEWMIQAIEQPENWRIISASEISEHEYRTLDGKVG